MDRINTTISKLDQLAHSIKSKEKTTLEKVPELTKKTHELEGENKALKNNIKQLEEKLEQKERQEKERAKNDQKTIVGLERQLEKKSKDFKSKEFIDIDQDKKVQEDIKKKDRQIEKYKDKLDSAEEQLRELRSQKTKVAKDGNSNQMERIVDENNVLKNNLAASSFKLAQLFNAAYDYGDSKLLDHLQAAIGLIE